MSKYNIDTLTVSEALAVPEIVKIVEKHFPNATRHPLLFLVRRKTLLDVLGMVKDNSDKQKIKLVREEISRL